LTVEIRQIRYFVEVATVGQFSKAASNLNMGQSTISEQIRALEHELGVELLARTSRSVLLTPAGEAFLNGAVRVLEDLSTLRDVVGEYSQGKRGHIRVGAIGPSLGTVVPLILREMKSRAPKVEVDVRTLSTERQIQQLLTGELEAGLVRGVKRRSGIRVEELVTEPLTAVLPLNHPLAKRTSLHLSELDGEAFVFWPRGANMNFYDQIIATCHQHGCAPGTFIASGDMQTQLAYISAGLGVSVQPYSFQKTGRSDVAFVPLDGAVKPVSLQIAWSPERETPTVRTFLDASRRVANFVRLGHPS
jgi:DNA-binding transcriptional LysR family regulator